MIDVADGEAALAIIDAGDTTIDLIISDVVMPNMDGHALVEAARKALGNVRVILMSGYAEETFHEKISDDPGVTFLDKPFTLQALATKVKEVLDRPPVDGPT